MDITHLSKNNLATIARLLDEQERAYDDGKLDKYHPNEEGEPGNTQLDFHKSNAKIRLVITGNRWGKTTASVIECIWLALGLHPYHSIPVPNRGKFYVVDYGQGNEVIRRKLDEWVPKKYLAKKKPYEFNQHNHLVGVNFWNGSYIKIGTYIQGKMSSEGSNWNYVAFDEPPPRELYIANLRGLVDMGGIMWFTMTPLHEAWIYDELWSPGLSGQKDYIKCITGNSYDNPHSDKDSLRLFADELTEDEYKIRIQGKFANLKGLVIDTYQPDKSDVDPFPLTSDYVLYEGIDPHPSKDHRVLWKAIHSSGYRYVVRELLWSGGIYDLGLAMVQIRAELQRDGALLYESVCDTSLNQTDPNFRINQRDELIRGIKAAGGRVFPKNAQKRDWLEAGITKLRDLYRPTLQIINDREVVAPMEYVFKTCTSYKYELAHYQWPNKQMMDHSKPLAIHNDLIDCNRYIESLAPKYQTPGGSGIVRTYNGAYQRNQKLSKTKVASHASRRRAI